METEKVEMATSRQEVVAKVTSYVERRYGGDWKKAFDTEDKDGDGRIDTGELETILSNAGVGFRLTRWAIAKQVIDALDSDGDGLVNWSEFEWVFKNGGAP